MRLNKFAVLISAFCIGAMNSPAQETNDVEQLKRQLQEMRENFEKAQREQRQQIESLTQKLDALVKQQQTDAEKKNPDQDLVAQLATNQPAPAAAAAAPPPSTSWSPSQPMTI